MEITIDSELMKEILKETSKVILWSLYSGFAVKTAELNYEVSRDKNYHQIARTIHGGLAIGGACCAVAGTKRIMDIML